MIGKSPPILNKEQVIQKIKRIAFQIYEENFQEQDIIFAGVQGSGYLFAQMLRDEFNRISPISSDIIKVSLEKDNPLESDVMLDKNVDDLSDKTIILVDDVVNSGRTLIYALKPFLKIKIKKLQTAILVDRTYRRFPIAADYVGYALSTTLQEHIEVILDDEETFGVYLS
jgi:pyrimidine operon attenuation protein / uracil phosphoribosyltransferase